MQRALAAALVVEKIGLALAQHHIARLKIAIQKVVTRRCEQELRQSSEIVFQCLFAERDTSQAQKIVLEVIQIPRYRLTVEAGARITHLVVQVVAGFDLEPW